MRFLEGNKSFPMKVVGRTEPLCEKMGNWYSRPDREGTREFKKEVN